MANKKATSSQKMSAEEAALTMSDMTEKTQTVEIPMVMRPPSADSPGFLKRMAQFVKFQDTVNKGSLDIPALEDLVQFLSEYVVEPEDRDEAKDMIWDLSENQFMKALSLMGGAADEVPPPSSES